MKNTLTILVIVVLLFNGCKREKLTTKEDLILNEAHTAAILFLKDYSARVTSQVSDYINNNITLRLNKESCKVTVLKNGQKLLIASLYSIEKKSIHNRTENLPEPGQIQNSKYSNKFENVIFFYDRNNSITYAQTVTVATNADGLNIANDIDRIIKFESNSYEGDLVYRSIEGKFLYTLSKEQNNSYSHSIIRKKELNQNSQSTYVTNTNCSYPIQWYLVTTITYPDGSTQTYEYYVGTTCGDANGCFPDPYLEQLTGAECGNNYGGTGTGEQGPPADILVRVDSINNLLQSPCFLQFVNSIGNGKLTTEVIKLYQSVFQGTTGNVFNIKFTEETNLRDSWGNEIPAKSRMDPSSSNTWTITLNSSLATMGTKEAWGHVILHEIIHGFIKKNDLDFKTGSIFNSATHCTMLENWIDQMKQAYIDIYSMSESDAKALALDSIDDILRDQVSGAFIQSMRDWTQQ